MPQQMILAVRIMWTIWGAWALFAAATFFGAMRVGVPSIGGLGVVYLLIIVSLALLVRAVARGRNWARWVYAAFLIIGMISGVMGLIRGVDSIARAALFLVLCVTYAVVLRLLFHPASSAWFKAVPKPAA